LKLYTNWIILEGTCRITSASCNSGCKK
jgi:hypothetical protein